VRYCILDTETTGFNPKKNKIIQITLKLSDSDKMLDLYLKHSNYEWNPYTLAFHKKVEPKILEIIEKEGVDVSTLKKELGDFWKDTGILNTKELKDNVVFVAYNAKFDKGFTDNILGLSSKYLPSQVLDVLKMAKDNKELKLAKKKGTLKNFKLETVAEYLKVEVEGDNFHNSRYDVLVTEQVFLKLKGDD